MCIKLTSLCRRFVVGCLEFAWVVGWIGWSWVRSFYFAMGWIGSVVWWVLWGLYIQSRKSLNMTRMDDRYFMCKFTVFKILMRKSDLDLLSKIKGHCANGFYSTFINLIITSVNVVEIQCITKMWHFILIITLPNVDPFLNIFHC